MLSVAAIFWGAGYSAGAEARFGYIPTDRAAFDEIPKVPRYRAFLPVSVDLSKHFPIPGMQDADSCTGWAVGYAARGYYAATLERRDVRQRQNVPSPSYIYNAIRDPRNCASGSEIPDALKLLLKGSLSFRDFDQACQVPSDSERARASDFRIKRWLAVDPQRADDIKGQVAQGNPVIFGIYVGEVFERLRGRTVYKGEAKAEFGHAMTIVGYDDKRQAYRVINSWGTLWGDRGFAWIDYGTFAERAREAYILEVEDMAATPSEEHVVVSPKPVVKPKPAAPQEVAIADPVPESRPQSVREISDADTDTSPTVERPVATSDCSLVYSDYNEGRQRLKGFVGAEKDLRALREQWFGYAEDFDVEIRPWPQCEVLLTLASAIGQQDRPRLSVKGEGLRFSEGNEMVFELVAPSSPTYLYVAYVQADGSVVTLMQPASDLAPSRRRERFVFGDGRGGSPRFTATPPLGTEMVVAVASASPLFDQPLPKMQTEREFLSALRRAVVYKSDQTKGDRRLSAAFLGIETEAKR